MKKIGIGLIVVIMLALVWLLRYGAIDIQTRTYSPSKSKYANWEEVFRVPGRFSVAPWHTGSIQVKQRTQFLNSKAKSFAQFQDPKKYVPVWAYYLQHPFWGESLIDTGFDQSFSTLQKGNYNQAGRLAANIMGVQQQQEFGESLNDHLVRTAARPKQVFLTHLHFDHTAGLPALPDVREVFVGKFELDVVARVMNGHYLNRPNLTLVEMELQQGQAMWPFRHALDLMGDGSLWALDTSGHTPGHVSYLIMTVEGPVLITGDACFYQQALALGIGPFAQYPKDLENGQASLKAIQQFKEKYPHVKIYAGHDDLAIEIQNKEKK